MSEDDEDKRRHDAKHRKRGRHRPDLEEDDFEDVQMQSLLPPAAPMLPPPFNTAEKLTDDVDEWRRRLLLRTASEVRALVHSKCPSSQRRHQFDEATADKTIYQLNHIAALLLTDLDAEEIRRRQRVIQQAKQTHRPIPKGALPVLERVGGAIPIAPDLNITRKISPIIGVVQPDPFAAEEMRALADSADVPLAVPVLQPRQTRVYGSVDKPRVIPVTEAVTKAVFPSAEPGTGKYALVRPPEAEQGTPPSKRLFVIQVAEAEKGDKKR